MFTLEEVIDLAIKIEENGEKVYRTAVNEDVLPYMTRIMEEEERHVKELEGALSAQPVGPTK